MAGKLATNSDERSSFACFALFQRKKWLRVLREKKGDSEARRKNPRTGLWWGDECGSLDLGVGGDGVLWPLMLILNGFWCF